MAFHPASIRDGRYSVTGVLGEGAQAQTLAAVDNRHGRAVAIKRFFVRGARSWKDVELAEREARVLGGLQHRNLPGYVEHFEEAGELYLVMERVEGESLQQLRKRGARLSPAEMLRLLTEMAEVLDYLHAHSPPIIHRDIKPGNVIRRPDGSFVLVDFGSVRDGLKVDGGSTVVGTFGYMAPEQFQGRALPQTDVYALGVTALSLLTGEEPENLPHRGLALDVTRALPGEPELAAFLTRLVEPDPDRRPGRVLPLLVELRSSTFTGPGGGRRGPRAPAGAPGPLSGSMNPPARRASHEPLPPLFVMVCVIGLRIASKAVKLTLGLLVPLLLVILSLLFGRGLRRAARQVREAGLRAQDALSRASSYVRRLEVAAESPAPWPPRQRVATAAGDARRGPRVVEVSGEEVSETEADAAGWQASRPSRRERDR
jgi:hypothetical protein